MSEVSYKERLKENVLSSSWKEELKASHEIRECIIRFIDGLSEEDAALLLSQDEKREVITRETKNIPLIVNPEEKDPEKLIRSSEDLGVIEYDRPLPRIADMLFLFAASPETRRESAEEQADLYWEKLADVYNFAAKYSAYRVEESVILATKLVQKLPEATSRQTKFAIREDWKQRSGHQKGKITKTMKTEVAVIMPSLDDETIMIPAEAGITDIDLVIYGGYVSSREAGNIAITDAMIFKAANGIDDGRSISPDQEASTRASMDKFRKTLAKIDATEEFNVFAEKNNLPHVDKYILDGNLISCERVIVELNGRVVEAYVSPLGKSHDPLLKKHADISDRIQRVSPDVLRIPTISNTERNMVLRNYLIIQVRRIKGGNSKNLISYNTLFKIAEADTRTEKARVRDNVRKILNHWKKIEHIKGYTEKKKGNAISGISIIY